MRFGLLIFFENNREYRHLLKKRADPNLTVNLASGR